MVVTAVGYLFGPEMDIAIIELALAVSVVLGVVVLAMSYMGMLSDDEDGPEY